jgi:hypothetical protein
MKLSDATPSRRSTRFKKKTSYIEDATMQAFQFATVTIMYLRIQLVSASLSVREPSSRLDIVLNPSELHSALPTTIPPNRSQSTTQPLETF